MYQIRLTVFGKFLFRTDWFDNSDHAQMALTEIKSKFSDNRYEVWIAAKSNQQVSITCGEEPNAISRAMLDAIKFVHPNG